MGIFESYTLDIELFSKVKHIIKTTDKIILFFKKLKYSTEPQKSAKGIYLQTELLNREAIKAKIV